jgi:hypothetical protein
MLTYCKGTTVVFFFAASHDQSYKCGATLNLPEPSSRNRIVWCTHSTTSITQFRCANELQYPGSVSLSSLVERIFRLSCSKNPTYYHVTKKYTRQYLSSHCAFREIGDEDAETTAFFKWKKGQSCLLAQTRRLCDNMCPSQFQRWEFGLGHCLSLLLQSVQLLYCLVNKKDLRQTKVFLPFLVSHRVYASLRASTLRCSRRVHPHLVRESLM